MCLGTPSSSAESTYRLCKCRETDGETPLPKSESKAPVTTKPVPYFPYLSTLLAAGVAGVAGLARVVEAGDLAEAGSLAEAGDLAEAVSLAEAGGLAGVVEAGGLAGVVEAGGLAGVGDIVEANGLAEVVTAGLAPASSMNIPTTQINAIIVTDQITMNSTVSTSIEVFVFVYVQRIELLIQFFYISVSKKNIFLLVYYRCANLCNPKRVAPAVVRPPAKSPNCGVIGPSGPLGNVGSSSSVL